MEYWKLIILGVVGLLIAAVLIEVWLKRGEPRSSLSDTLGKDSKFDAEDKVPLGMEEIDMDIVHAAARQNANIDSRDWQYTKK